MKFSMLNGSHLNVHRISNLIVVHMFKHIFNLGHRAVNMVWAHATLIPYWC